MSHNTSVFEFVDYKEFVHAAVTGMPHKGRGQFTAIAKHLRVHTSLLSHVFRGTKDLTAEQTCALAGYFELGDLETDYLLALVEHARAGTETLRRVVARRLASLRDKYQQLEYRVPGAKVLSTEQQSTFYSHWYYSAVRLTASLEDVADAESIANRLSLPVTLVEKVLTFLVAADLLVHTGSRYKLSVSRTHVGSKSPLAVLHHRNWRSKASSLYDGMDSTDFAYTAPISLSQADFLKLRELMVALVSNATDVVAASKCETVAVINLDLLRLA